MSELLQRVESAVNRRRLFVRGQKILVAVSGGADSMALLHVLDLLGKKHRWQISVAHFNHRLRGRASEADEKLVRATAKKLRLKFFGGGADVKKFSTQSKISVEMAARQLRHEFLARTARKDKISTVALAHHADDQVELFFLRLLRGTGGEGLAGMKWRSASPVDKAVLLVRPLLDFSKAELLAFAKENKICFRDDATNFSTDFLRNRIRNGLLPLLRKNYQPAVDKTVLRLMEIVGAEAEFVGNMARKAASGLWLDPVRPQAERYSGLPVAIQRKVLQVQLMELGLVSDFDLIEQLRDSPGKFVSVRSGLAVACDAGGKLNCRESHVAKFSPVELKLKLSGRAGRVKFCGIRFQWALKKYGGLQGRSPHQPQREFFDADKIDGEIVLRHWRAGDRFQPSGMESAAKLQDLFVNAKIPAAQRRKLVLAATAAGEIFWVQGLRIGENFKLTAATKRQLVWNHPKIGA
ncbi:MAG TPA: tRNA lysidine(34) synthetase TilS [Verrucomicrobiae bacterium]